MLNAIVFVFSEEIAQQVSLVRAFRFAVETPCAERDDNVHHLCAQLYDVCVCLYSFLDRMDEDRTDRGRSHFSLGKQTLLDPTATQLKSCTVVCMIVCYFIFVHPFQETLVAFVSVSVLSNVDPCLFPTLTD